MSIKQWEGVLTHRDKDGNKQQMFPEIKTDASLSISGKAADAAVTGAKFKYATPVKILQADFDKLSDEQKANGSYLITDAGIELPLEQIGGGGSTNYASSVNCLDKDGNKSTVQAEVDKLWEADSEQNKKFASGGLTYNEETDCFGFTYNGVWYDIAKAYLKSSYLYAKGNAYTDITGGWSAQSSTGTSGGSLTHKDNYMRLNKVANGNISARTVKEINMSGYTKLCCKIKLATDNNMAVNLYVTNASGSLCTDVLNLENADILTENVITLDISDVTSGFPEIRAAGSASSSANTVYIYEVYME